MTELTKSITRAIGSSSTIASSAAAKNRVTKTASTGTKPLFFPGGGKTPPKVSKDFEADSQETQNKNGIKPENKSGKVVPTGFKFNLPPHKWSLPTQPSVIEGEFQDKLALPPNRDKTILDSFHGLRRGRMWWFNTNSIVTGMEDGKVVKPYQGAPGPSDLQKFVRDAANATKAETVEADRHWGFQFLWNPENINISVDVNLEVTPSSADRLRTVGGFFPGMEYISLNLILDRTNDMACIRSGRFGKSNWESLANKFYSGSGFPEENKVTETYAQKVEKLAVLGTNADIEYLFRMINGSGINGTDWVNLLGRKTADIGFLQPSLLGIQLGPNKSSLSYVGWVNNLSINHIAFTQSMTPIRTQISMGIRCFSGSSITSL